MSYLSTYTQREIELLSCDLTSCYAHQFPLTFDEVRHENIKKVKTNLNNLIVLLFNSVVIIDFKGGGASEALPPHT